MKEKSLLDLIDEGLSLKESLMVEYRGYPPIFNSILMLNDIRNNIDDSAYLKNNRDRLNVGLLAAKALDCENNPKILSYSASLHSIWAKFLSMIGRRHRILPSTNQKISTAYDFYKKYYYLKNRQPDDNKIYNHMSGIDFNFPVGVSKLKKGEIVSQWRAMNMSQGDYYCETKRATRPDCLGVNEYQADYHGNVSKRVKHEHEVVTQDTDVLKSVAAGVLDTWSVIGPPQQTTGGCIQYFNPEKNFFNQQYP